MADDINAIIKQNLFRQLHGRLNYALLRDSSPDSQNRPGNNHQREYVKPTPEEVVFISKLCRFLHQDCGQGTKGDMKDTVQRIANVGSPQNLSRYLTVHHRFLEQMQATLANPAMEGRFGWIAEKNTPDKVCTLIDMISDHLDAMQPRVTKANAEWPDRPDKLHAYMVDQYKDFPERTEMFKNRYDPAQDGKPITARNQVFDKVDTLANDHRARVVYFGGMIQRSEEPEFINRAMRRIKRALEPGHVPPKDYDIYVMKYNNRASMRKTHNLLSYNIDPEHFSSPTAKAVVELQLRPLYANSRGGKLPEEELYRQASLTTFVGYSYGTAFIQEVRNALADKLKAMGYSPKAVKKALSLIAAFNFSSVVNVSDKRARGDFTQVHSTADGDSATYLHSNIPDLVAADPNPLLKQYRIEDEHGLHTLALQGAGLPGNVMSFKTRPIEEVIPGEPLTGLHAAGSPTNKIKVRVIDEAIIRNDGGRHHIVNNYRIDGVRPDDNELVLRNNPAAEYVNRSLRNQVRGSIAVSNGEQKERDAAGINRQVADYVLTPEKIGQKAWQHYVKLRNNLEAQVARGHIPQSRRPPND